MTTVSVVGVGYLGAVHAASMASIGHTVIGVDVDERKLAELSAARAPFFEPGLPELLVETQDSARLTFTSDPSAVAAATVHFVCVGTPQSADGLHADLTYVHAAVESILPHIGPGHLVVGKSTVPVGTAAELAGTVRATGAELAWNPEFLREGKAVQDTLRPDRLVYGVPDGDAGEQATEQLDEVYAIVLDRGTPRIVADYPTAELVKTAANSFLATKISFINAMAELCESAGGDVTVLADAIGIDDRIGRKFLNAGLGFGGGCLPKDIRAFIARADDLGAGEAVSFLREIDAINLRRRERMVELALGECGGDIDGVRVTVLGAAFKPDSDDTRDSPALAVAAALHAQGAVVTVTDPEGLENARRREPQLTYEEDLTTALTGAGLVLLLTEWSEYRQLDPVTVKRLVEHPRLLDGRNVLDPAAWRGAGWTYRALGRP
ncbi:UDP-glucose dehydrogenase family protein [Brevibacterium jeotgali]|uniref:UDP-glucose 6-dehydrogenase n=1 Tax=Brevibacterium jeotgali TaxID=1262550 RepID=A0A2H1L2L0_9MICO|nr:UDP-glucose/GDP-mannose dehydrogenase family protein [Brevibacterium jeotgali]TWC03007.1 UDPglucose 6-dehydrogenase [Brevibacterium jeotgali]SMY11030.1 UDPglucose 6-dehydrogenase [Brevibacterium jeotgali]